MRTLALYSLLFTTLVGQAVGFGYFDSMTKGTILPCLSPAHTALGSLRAVGIVEPTSIFINPAQISLLPATVQLSGASIHWSERVMQSDINKTLRTMNKYNNGTAAVVVPIGSFVIGGGIAKVGEFSYEGSHTVYDNPDDPELGVAVLYADGSQWEALASVSKIITGPLSVGFSGGVRMVSADYSYFFNSHQSFLPDSSSVWAVEDTSFAWHAGLALTGELFKSGVSYSSSTDYMEDIIAFGGSALAEHLKNTTVGFEAQIASPFDGNRFMGNLYVQNPLTERLNVLTSVSFDDQRVANRAGLGFGLGFNLAYDRLTIGGGVLNRFKARKNSAFPNEQSDRVDDSSLSISMGLSYEFGI